MDVLSDILRQVKLRGSLYFRTEFSAPWGVRVPFYSDVARFHMVIRGQCWVAVDKKTVLDLRAGDFIVITRGAEHCLLSQPEASILGLDDVIAKSGFKGQGALMYGGEDAAAQTSLVCGHFEFDPLGGKLFLDSLPPYILVRGSQQLNYGWLNEAMKFIEHEIQGNEMGAEAIVTRLSELLFIRVIRSLAPEADVGVFAALRDRQIGRALQAIHSKPNAPWTLLALAAEAGMSRTAFAERAKTLLGMAPMHYVTYWRMELARQRLEISGDSVERIAEIVGYQSPPAFIRAFKKHYGMGPGGYKKRLQSRQGFSA